MSEKTDCILFGGYAGGNAGDELTLALALKDTQKQFQHVSVLSRNPEYTQWLFPGTKVIRVPALHFDGQRSFLERLLPAASARKSIRKKAIFHWFEQCLQAGGPWIDAICKSGQMYLVGGGYLTDHFPLYEFLLPVWIARKCGIPVTTAPLGIGPIRDLALLEIAISLLRETHLQVRDNFSLAFCNHHDLRAILKEDDGFRLLEVIPEAQISTNQVPNRKVGICMFYQQGSEITKFAANEWYEALLKQLRDRIGEEHIEGFCFHTAYTMDFYQTITCFQNAGIQASRVLPPFIDYRLAFRNLQNYSAILTTRFHAAVASSVFNIPCFAVSSGTYYQSKMELALEGRSSVTPVELTKQDPQKLADYLADLYLHQGKIGD